MLGRHLCQGLGAALACWLGFGSVPVTAAAEIVAGDAVIQVSENGDITGVRFADGSSSPLPVTRNPFCILEAGNKQIFSDAVKVSDDAVEISFADGSRAALQLQPAEGFSLFRLLDLDLKTSVTGMKLPTIPVPTDARFNPTLNSAFADQWAVGVLSASPEILASNGSSSSRTADLPGCTHNFIQVANAKEGSFAAEFVSTCSLSSSGWSMQGNSYNSKISRDSVTGLKAWVHGDGKGQQLKFQLVDAGGGATDYYLPIDFVGWREITMTDPALHIVKETSVSGLNLYYNGIPGDTTVRCMVDNIRLLVGSNGATETVTLETFEDQDSPWWNDGVRRLGLHWDFNYAGVGDAFGIIACAKEEFFEVMPRFEAAAGILTPYPDGVWNKKAPSVKESYLFLTAFSEAHFDEALALAKQGGFKHVLLEQHSWCESTGHYGINKRNFPDGLEGLVRTVNRFRENGIKVGLHLLGASIDNNDPYITPVPDNRLLKDAQTSLLSTLDPSTTTIVVTAMPEGFPAEDGGYNGDGTILQIGSELVQYGSRTTTAPFTFYNCIRGYHGTIPSAHRTGADVHHLARSYGYHMMDMDYSLLDEVTSNFAKVANTCDIDMVYFDGSERLQGEHQRYNARLINAYLSKFDRKDIIVQASSFSHHSWHQLARTASADGHGDLKGYLEQRSPSFKDFAAAGLPLDVGWYYGYDTLATPDMYEYILGATIGYDSSFSFQVSVPAAQKHPFTSEILNLIARYEKLRLSGRVDENLKALLRVHEQLQGRAPEDASRDVSVRRDYRLLSANNKDVLQRVIYGEWQSGDATTSGTTWNVEVTTSPAMVGVQLQALPTSDKAVVNPQVEINGQVFGWNGTVQPGEYVVFWPEEPARLYSPGDKQKEAASAPSVSLKEGAYKFSFSCDAASSGTYRVRVNLQCPEKHVIP